MKQVDRYIRLQHCMKDVSPRVRQAFSAAIAERFLPSAKNSMSSWRRGSWEILRNTLDKAWDYLEQNSNNKKNFEDILKIAKKQIPRSEDKNWDGAHGVFGSCVTIISTINSIVSVNSNSAADASNEAIEELRQFIVFTRFGHLEVEPYFDEDEIFDSKLICDEVHSQDRQLEALKVADLSDIKFREKVLDVRKLSENNPIVFRSE